MKTHVTLFKAILVQDSALSVSGLDRSSPVDTPLALIDGQPIMVGRGLKGAAVAMAKRFFDPLPRAVSDDVRHGALRRSTWEFEDIQPLKAAKIERRVGVGIRQKTGARAGGILFDKEVVPAGTRWELTLRVQWSYAINEDEAREAEGILGYVLSEHWAKGRCWLGGGAARGLGWCTLTGLKAYRLEGAQYEAWVAAQRQDKALPKPLAQIPTVSPTRDWYFETLKASLHIGSYQEQSQSNWGLDMLAIGAHASNQGLQVTADERHWLKPEWASSVPDYLETDRAILMEGKRPLLPGSSLRGPLRHALSRQLRMQGQEVLDPHLVQGKVGAEDPAGQVFGCVEQSSHVLIRDALAEPDWRAVKLHMHAEDEFSAGSYGSAKRDAVRLVRAKFPIHLVIEGPTPEALAHLKEAIARQVRLGELGHLGLGGHKTRGAGFGTWKEVSWQAFHAKATRQWQQPQAEIYKAPQSPIERFSTAALSPKEVALHSAPFKLEGQSLTVQEAAELAKQALGTKALVAWWCEPSIDFSVTQAPEIFGTQWPEASALKVDEIAFFSEDAVWRVARTSQGLQGVWLSEGAAESDGAQLPKDASNAKTNKVRKEVKPVRVHGFARFSSQRLERQQLQLVQWMQGDECLGFTLSKGGK